ncbi:MAG: imidazole glycerol phosphate synthase subunit HisH [Gilvibacter sp.]
MIAILKYNAGNISSVQNALNRLNCENELTDDIEKIKKADKVIIPGVGQASYAMQDLRTTGLDRLIPELTQPVLGICLGLQLLCKQSQEGQTTCLGVFDTDIKKLPEKEIVPHTGWNELKNIKSSLLKGISTKSDFYFVHSYYAALCEQTTAECDYILPFSAVLERDNFYATQFHPEKSSTVGNKLLKNFLSL